MATTVALQYISQLRLTETPAMVTQALQYLQRTLNEENELGEAVPKSVAQFPRATWWEYLAVEKSEQHWANPSAEIVGYLYEFSDVVLHDLRDRLTRKAFMKLDNSSETLEMHDLLCYLRLGERLPAELQAQLYTRLDPHVHAVVTTTPEQWKTYGLPPIHVAPSPESYYFAVFESAIYDNLAFQIANQSDNGTWDPTWTWGRYEEDWLQAREEWRGLITLGNLRTLQAYNRVENASG